MKQETNMRIVSTKHTHNQSCMNGYNDVKRVAQDCISLDKSEFELTSVNANDVDDNIWKEIIKETTGEGLGRGLAFVIDVFDNKDDNCLSTNNRKLNMNLKNNTKNRQQRVFSPQPNTTYFWVNMRDLNSKGNEKSYKYNIEKDTKIISKLSNGYTQHKKLNLKDIIVRRAKSPKIKHKVLESLIKKYTYKFLKNPYQLSSK